jgi:hypothetical protein
MKATVVKNINILFLLLLPAFAWGQIKIMPKHKAQSIKVERYDSLTNFEEKDYGYNNPRYNGKRGYYHLKGQTILYCGAGFKKCKYGSYYIIEDIVTKNNLPYLRLRDKKTNQTIDIFGVLYNSDFVVQGHYEKLKKIFVGKRYICDNSPFDAQSHFFDVNTGNYVNPADASVWKCVDIEVEDRREHSPMNKYSPLLLVFQSENSSKKIYCYYENFYGFEEITKKELSSEDISKSKLKEKYGDYYGSAISEGQLKAGMTKAMVLSLFENKKPNTKNVSINMQNGKTKKEERWVYNGILTDQEGNPLTLTLIFDEQEKLSDWLIEK